MKSKNVHGSFLFSIVGFIISILLVGAGVFVIISRDSVGAGWLPLCAFLLEIGIALFYGSFSFLKSKIISIKILKRNLPSVGLVVKKNEDINDRRNTYFIYYEYTDSLGNLYYLIEQVNSEVFYRLDVGVTIPLLAYKNSAIIDTKSLDSFKPKHNILKKYDYPSGSNAILYIMLASSIIFLLSSIIGFFMYIKPINFLFIAIGIIYFLICFILIYFSLRYKNKTIGTIIDKRIEEYDAYELDTYNKYLLEYEYEVDLKKYKNTIQVSLSTYKKVQLLDEYEVRYKNKQSELIIK